MSDSKAILEAALKLETAERIRLLVEISTSLDGLDLGDEWEAEIARRVADVDSGRVKTTPGDQAFAQVRRRLGDR